VHDEQVLSDMHFSPPETVTVPPPGTGRADPPPLTTSPALSETAQSVPAATTPPQTEKAPVTVPGGVYARTDNVPFTGGTRLIVRVVLESVIRGINNKLLNLLGFLFSTKDNYSNNKELLFDDGEYIVNQDSGEAASVRMGVQFSPIQKLFGSNACGWIAAYNSFLSLGMYVHPADIVDYIENNNGLNALGMFGTNPLVFDRLFRVYGLKSTTTLFESALSVISNGDLLTVNWNSLPSNNLPSTLNVNLDLIAKQGRAIILSYWNNKNDLSKGAHYVHVVWDKKTERYTARNISKYIPLYEFESIGSFLGNKHGLISMIVIH
jgi:hypothetical protein